MPQQCIRGSEAGVLQYFEDETRRDLATKMLLDAFGSPETRDGRGDLHSALGVRLGRYPTGYDDGEGWEYGDVFIFPTSPRPPLSPLTTLFKAPNPLITLHILAPSSIQPSLYLHPSPPQLKTPTTPMHIHNVLLFLITLTSTASATFCFLNGLSVRLGAPPNNPFLRRRQAICQRLPLQNGGRGPARPAPGLLHLSHHPHHVAERPGNSNHTNRHSN
ncbi:hypothetical protein EX30DRAFT_389925 [Ascodesmis nigricans]|uniref:Uncharacterized protein n=1 Tax=Ascodesmis nigricans TaxID=341454 RepID=A0A4S2MN52_9PEZI|nr:hypothetical protein EX30DRAFT_389925 [Ascodesmis nigricans]